MSAADVDKEPRAVSECARAVATGINDILVLVNGEAQRRKAHDRARKGDPDDKKSAGRVDDEGLQGTSA